MTLRLETAADAPEALGRGVQGLAGRCAKAVNRAVGRRGRVWSSRFLATIGWSRVGGPIAIDERPGIGRALGHISDPSGGIRAGPLNPLNAKKV